jgi:hypothetical protein
MTDKTQREQNLCPCGRWGTCDHVVDLAAPVLDSSQTDPPVADQPRRVEVPTPPAVRWSPADLDRCEHGRHSIDHCFDCPGGNKGNPFLFTEIPPHNAFPENVRYENGRVEVRIGTMVHGEPIWVVVQDKPRS